MTKPRSWLHRWLGRSANADDRDATGGQTLAPRPTRTVDGSAAYQWEVVASLNSAPLGGMYADLLRQANIPVLARGWQSVPVAGAPIGVTLLVPRERLAEAQVILGLDDDSPAELTSADRQLAPADQADAEAADTL